MNIFSLAHRFGMNELLRACAEVLDECMNCDDVCRVLEAVEYYQDEVLEAKCWDLIKESTPRCTLLRGESLCLGNFPENGVCALPCRFLSRGCVWCYFTRRGEPPPALAAAPATWKPERWVGALLAAVPRQAL